MQIVDSISRDGFVIAQEYIPAAADGDPSGILGLTACKLGHRRPHARILNVSLTAFKVPDLVGNFGLRVQAANFGIMFAICYSKEANRSSMERKIGVNTVTLEKEAIERAFA